MGAELASGSKMSASAAIGNCMSARIRDLLVSTVCAVVQICSVERVCDVGVSHRMMGSKNSYADSSMSLQLHSSIGKAVVTP